MYNIHFQNLPEHTEVQINDFIQKFETGVKVYHFNTSGSTGKPKKTLVSRERLINSALMTVQALNLKSYYVVLNCLNTDFIAGKMMLVRSMVLNMKCIVVPPSADPLQNLSENIDFAGFIPYQLYTMLTNNKTHERIEQLNRMKVIIIGGDRITNQLFEAIQQIKTPIYHTYGMTETVSHIALKLLNGVNKQNSFEVLKGVKIKIDERNCIQIQTPATNNMWVNTNDVVELVDDTHFNLLGRIDNVIVSGGIKIPVESVEKSIDEYLFKRKIYFKILVTSIPHDALSQELVLILEKEENIEKIFELNLLQELSKNLPKYHTPKKIFVLEEFVKLATGKINRKETTLLLLNKIVH